jgi:hypothetical protein
MARDFDLVVAEATPAGIACAVTAARLGLRVLLTNRTPHLGGMPANGLSVWDTAFEGRRSPVYDEVRERIFEHYRGTYGEGSQQYRCSLPRPRGHNNGLYEAHVAERVLTEVVRGEPLITCAAGRVVAAVEREGRLVRSVRLRDAGGGAEETVRAPLFADCTYEGDLMAAAGASFRVGREGRGEHGEPHAGHILVRDARGGEGALESRVEEARERLRLRRFGPRQVMLPDSTGAGDSLVQAYNLRTVLSSDPANRVMPVPSSRYDPRELRDLQYGGTLGPLPNGKHGWNRPQLVGLHQAWPLGDGEARRRVYEEHVRVTLDLLYFLQHDPSVPEEVRGRWAGLGLARDEFPDNGHVPYEIYVREARRLEGRDLMTEHDLMLSRDIERSRVRPDAVATTEWYIDCHACTPQRIGESLHEGKFMLYDDTFPAGVPYPCLLPREIDNLAVPVCVSATHVAWNAVRLEATWMNIAEAAGHAAAQAAASGATFAAIDVERLQRRLARERVMISFFNDVDVSLREPWVAAVQYFGTKGFFRSYDARPGDSLDSLTGRLWARAFGDLRAGRLDAAELARSLPLEGEAEPIDRGSFAALAGLPAAAAAPPPGRLTRAEACLLLYDAISAEDP